MTDTRIIPCPECGGDKGHDVPYDIDRRDGSTIDCWQPCVACDATGDQEIETQPCGYLTECPSCKGMFENGGQCAAPVMRGGCPMGGDV